MKTNPAPKAYKIRIGANVRKWRSLKSIKQKDLAGALNLSEAAVSNIENDVTNVNLRQLEDIAQALSVSVEQLLNDPEETYTYPGSVRYGVPALFEKELMEAIIQSLQKKDEQIKAILETVLQRMTADMRSVPGRN
jgi:transcriptional regulator with XRE-family HTH domain